MPRHVIQDIGRPALLGEAAALKASGHRLVQVCSTPRTDHLELLYSFDKDYALTSLKLQVPAADAVVPSISGIFAGAFSYENEMKDLFGLKVEGLAVDYHGNFLRTKVPQPFLRQDAGKEA